MPSRPTSASALPLPWAEKSKWSPTETRECQGDGTGSEAVVPLSVLQRALKNGESLADIVGAIIWTTRPVPPLTIIEDAPDDTT